MKNLLRRNRGITLIALIITIIVLLILAGVTIQTLTGDNGLLQKAQKAGEENEKSKELELIELAVQSAQIAGEGTITTDNLNSELKNNFNNNIEASETSVGWLYQSNENYRIYNNGKVENIEILPPGYKKIEYLESTGTQYINSKIKTTNDTECMMDCMILQASNGEGFIGYNRRSLNSNWSYIRHYTYDIFDYGDKRILVNAVTKCNKRYKIYFGNGYLSIPEENLYQTGNKSTSIPNDEIYLFGSFFDNNNVISEKMKIYEVDLYKKNNILAQFIPISDNNDVGCMYEKITGKIFYNQGTGEFIVGPEI